MPKKLSINGDGYAIAQHVAALKPFDTYGNMYAVATHGSFYSTGWLCGSALERLYADANTVDYIVYSYRTPILWHTPERGWVEIDHRFSQTSSKHQSRASLGLYYSDDRRVTSPQVSYGLSDAQRSLLQRIANTTMPVRTASITGHESRTLTVLYRLDLVQDNLNGYLTVTDKGREVWS